MNDLKIGVIVTCFNHAHQITACIESIIKSQYLLATTSRVKLYTVVIDDCSSDDSFSILTEYVELGKIEVVKRNSSNKGVSFSRNRGIELCKNTDYIYFVDADDVLHDNFINLFKRVLSGDLIVSNFSYCSTVRGHISDEMFFPEDLDLQPTDIADYLLKYYERPNKNNLFTTCWSKLYRTKILFSDKNNWFNEKMHLCEDTDFVYRFLSLQEGGVQFINELLYVHTLDEPGRNNNKLSFGINVELSQQLSFLTAVNSSKKYMEKHVLSKDILEKKIDHCISAYLIIYSIRSCLKVKSIGQFVKNFLFWRQTYKQPVFRKSILNYSPKLAGGNALLPSLIKKRLYLLATLVSYYLCIKRYN